MVGSRVGKPRRARAVQQPRRHTTTPAGDQRPEQTRSFGAACPWGDGPLHSDLRFKLGPPAPITVGGPVRSVGGCGRGHHKFAAPDANRALSGTLNLTGGHGWPSRRRVQSPQGATPHLCSRPRRLCRSPWHRLRLAGHSPGGRPARRRPPPKGAWARAGGAATNCLRPRPTFSRAARHNPVPNGFGVPNGFRRGKSVGPPWRARRSHFFRVRESSLFGGTAGAARFGARPTEPPGQPPRLRTLQHPDESSLRRPGILRSLGRSVQQGPSGPARGGPRAEQAGRSPLGRPLLWGEGPPRWSGARRADRRGWPRPRWGAGRGRSRFGRPSRPRGHTGHRLHPPRRVGAVAREGPTGSVVRARPPRTSRRKSRAWVLVLGRSSRVRGPPTRRAPFRAAGLPCERRAVLLSRRRRSRRAVLR
jgi:hypothetical protein